MKGDRFHWLDCTLQLYEISPEDIVKKDTDGKVGGGGGMLGALAGALLSPRPPPGVGVGDSTQYLSATTLSLNAPHGLTNMPTAMGEKTHTNPAPAAMPAFSCM